MSESSLIAPSHTAGSDISHSGNDSYTDSISRKDADKTSSLDSGFECLMIVAQLHGMVVDAEPLRHEFGSAAFTAQTLLLAARHIGLIGKIVHQDARRIPYAPLPVIAIGADGRYSVVAKLIDSDIPKLLISQPGNPPRITTITDFCASWSGQLIYLSPRPSIGGPPAHFDFRWFIPAILKYRRLFGEVILISLFIQVLALTTPLFFQVMMDKVLVNRANETLDVLAVGLTCAILFDAALVCARSYVFAHTTSKIDIELGARLFRHLISLPLSYFHARRVGDSVARVRELENIRSFLTGNAVTLLIDLLFSLIFVAVMWLYSPHLTAIVLFTVPIYALLSIIFTPLLRARLNKKFDRSSENHSFLVESLHGAETLKSLAVEPGWIRQWEQQLSGYITAGLAASLTGLFAATGVRLVGKLTTVAIIWTGAHEVMQGTLTLGELIAFNMLAGQVTGPILRLAQLWNDFQQVGISVRRLGDILNAPAEVHGRQGMIPRLIGSIEFDSVSFRYRPDSAEALRGISFKVAPGEILGIVGRSGSGKSTVTKLVQRLYVPERGRILIDGHDLATTHPASLRSQVGVVLQDSLLFNRTVRMNIALTNPAASLAEVIATAKLAGAHEFICELPEGYDTVVGENGSSLSGGQRQRIAIARALLKDPKILIMDEATSALDYESERAIQDAMERICAGRTVIIVAHRLSALRNARRILVLERGEVAEYGPVGDLLAAPNGFYAKMHHMQSRVA